MAILHDKATIWFWDDEDSGSGPIAQAFMQDYTWDPDNTPEGLHADDYHHLVGMEEIYSILDDDRVIEWKANNKWRLMTINPSGEYESTLSQENPDWYRTRPEDEEDEAEVSSAPTYRVEAVYYGSAPRTPNSFTSSEDLELGMRECPYNLSDYVDRICVNNDWVKDVDPDTEVQELVILRVYRNIPGRATDQLFYEDEFFFNHNVRGE